MASKLEEIWKTVTADMPENVTVAWWGKLLQKYGEENRSYHNVDHLLNKFEHFDLFRSQMKDQRAIAFALFFHYFEYDPKSVDCEERNVRHFENFADEGGISKESLLRSGVIDLLRVAATHSTDEHKTGGAFGDEDRHFFLDIDMAVLGSSPQEYYQYTSKVQQEYAFLPETMYKNLRLKVLQNFLQIPNIFASKEFREQFEIQARSNIQNEVDMLIASLPEGLHV